MRQKLVKEEGSVRNNLELNKKVGMEELRDERFFQLVLTQINVFHVLILESHSLKIQKWRSLHREESE